MDERYITRFWAKVDRTGGPDSCWDWGNSKGYGKMVVDGKERQATHVSWEIHTGAPPTHGMWVLHHCDNPPCVNPSHLFLGSHADNMADAASKGRMWMQKNPERARRISANQAGAHRARGERHWKAALSEKDVLSIRQRAANGESQASLARAYGLTNTGIGHVIRGKNWRHVGGPIRTGRPQVPP